VLNSPVFANWTASATDSGLAGTTATRLSGEPIDTSSPGRQTFCVEAIDLAGNVTRVEHEYHNVYALSPTGAGGSIRWMEEGITFLDRRLSVNGAEFNGVPLAAIYTIGETIGISFIVTDIDGNPIPNVAAGATMVRVTLADDGSERYEIVWTYSGDPLAVRIIPPVAYYADLGSYALSIRTAVPSEGWKLNAGIYDLWLEFNDGTKIHYRIGIIEPTG